MVRIFPAMSLLDILYFMSGLSGGLCLQTEQQWWPQPKMNLMAGSAVICCCCPQESHEKLTWQMPVSKGCYLLDSIFTRCGCLCCLCGICLWYTSKYLSQVRCRRGVDQDIKGYEGYVGVECMVSPFKMAVLLLSLHLPAQPVPAPLTGLSNSLKYRA